jgi:hypothetical protein
MADRRPALRARVNLNICTELDRPVDFWRETVTNSWVNLRHGACFAASNVRSFGGAPVE